MKHIILVILILSSVFVQAQLSNDPDEFIRPVDGDVQTMKIDTLNQILYIGGSFTSYNPAFTNGGEFQLDSLKINRNFPEITGNVNCAVPDGSGGWYVGGKIYSVDGVLRDRFAHILANGTLGSWQMTFLNNYEEIFCMELVGNELIIGGNIVNINGQTRSYLVSFDVSTQTLNSWSPVLDNMVHTLKNEGDTLYIGGNFSSFDGNSRGAGAAVTVSTKFLLQWDPRCNSGIYDVEVFGDSIMIGGAFVTIQGLTNRDYLAVTNNSNGDVLSANVFQDDIVYALHKMDDYVYVGGSYGPFNVYNYLSRYYLPTLTRDVGFQPDLDAPVTALTSYNNKLIVGGEFSHAEDSIRDYVAFYNHNTLLLEPDQFHVEKSSTFNGVKALVTFNDRLFVGGKITSMGGDIRHKIAGINLYNGDVTPFNPLIEPLPENGSFKIYDIELSPSGDSIYFVGKFFGVNYNLSHNLAIGMEVSTGNIIWNPTIAGFQVNAVELLNNTLYIGGNLTEVNGTTITNLCAMDHQGNVSFAPTLNSVVNELELLSDTALAIGGTFNSFNGTTRLGFAVVSIPTYSLDPFDLGLNAGSNIREIKENNTSIFVAGKLVGASGSRGFHQYDAITQAKLYPDPPLTNIYDFVQISADSVVLAHPGPSGLFPCISSYDYTANIRHTWHPFNGGNGGKALEYYRGMLIAGGEIASGSASSIYRRGLASYTVQCIPVNGPTTLNSYYFNGGATITGDIYGSFPMVCQWEVSTDNGVSYTTVTNDVVYSGAETPELQINSYVGLIGNWYRLTCVNACASFNATPMELTGPCTTPDSNLTLTECESYQFFSTLLIQSGIYTETIQNTSGCDSTINLNLTIINNSYGTDTQIACNSLIWIDGNTYTTNNNSATHTFPGGATNGCDSIVTLNLTINNSTTGIDTKVVCDSLTWIDGSTYTSNNNSATYTYIGGAANGCDSVVTLDLTINNSNTGTDTQSACSPYVWIDGNTYTQNNNTATHMLTTSTGCDSVITLDLTINTVNSAVTQNGINLTADLIGATYKWLDCNNGNMPISGEVNQSFTATANGNYAVEVTENSCVDTSVCFLITTVGVIESNFKNRLVVYPNPTNGAIVINLGGAYSIVRAKVLSVNGQLISTEKFENSEEINLEIEGPAGYYFIDIVATGNNKATIRILKE